MSLQTMLLGATATLSGDRTATIVGVAILPQFGTINYTLLFPDGHIEEAYKESLLTVALPGSYAKADGMKESAKSPPKIPPKQAAKTEGAGVETKTEGPAETKG